MSYANIGIIILIGFVISVVITKYEIPFLRAKAGQNIREDGPESHLSKAGTPSMGGIAIIIGAVLATLVGGLLWSAEPMDILVILFVFVGFGLIGFFDDYLKVIKKVNLGLRAYQKFGLQIVISVALAVFLANYSDGSTYVYIPVVDTYIDFGVWYIPFIVFVMLAMTNAVNLTDGLDGLASGVTAFITLFFAVAGIAYGVAGPVPMRSHHAEDAIQGHPVSADTIRLFGEKVLEDIHPRSSWRGSKEFRQYIAVELAKRCLTESIKLAGGVIE